MAYTHFQYIAYQVPTVVSKLYHFAPGSVTNPPALEGPVSELSSDAKSRLERLFAVLKKAAADSHISKTSTTLKIFIVPEFYFRNDSDTIYYSLSEYSAIKKVLRATYLKLSEGEDAILKHWLIIPGTIMWVLKAKEKTLKQKKGSKNKDIYFNSCAYLYYDGKKLDSKVLEKARPSSIDGLPLYSATNQEPHKSNSAPSSIFSYYKKDPKFKKHILDISGIRIGVEICLEHSMGVVKAGLTYWQEEHSETYNLMYLQLITAGGMGIKEDKVAVEAGGHILRNDGLQSSTRGAVELKCVNRSFTGGKVTLAPPSPDKTHTITISDTMKDLYLPVPASLTAANFMPEQAIKIYDAVRINSASDPETEA